jgi:hypothetical protein
MREQRGWSLALELAQADVLGYVLTVASASIERVR